MPGFPDPPVDDEAPPILGTWRRVYFAVVLYLAVLIAALSVISSRFTY